MNNNFLIAMKLFPLKKLKSLCINKKKSNFRSGKYKFIYKIIYKIRNYNGQIQNNERIKVFNQTKID
jgi:hypothetical protein